MPHWEAPERLQSAVGLHVHYVCGCVYVSYLTLSQLSLGEGLFGRPEAQLSADHAGCSDVPQVVTHGAPLPLLQHLNAALPEPGPRLQTHDRLEGERERLGCEMEKWKFVN